MNISDINYPFPNNSLPFISDIFSISTFQHEYNLLFSNLLQIGILNAHDISFSFYQFKLFFLLFLKSLYGLIISETNLIVLNYRFFCDRYLFSYNYTAWVSFPFTFKCTLVAVLFCINHLANMFPRKNFS